MRSKDHDRVILVSGTQWLVRTVPIPGQALSLPTKQMEIGMSREDISNKEVLDTLKDMKDNHLSHIQENTAETNRLLKTFVGALSKIMWIFVAILAGHIVNMIW